MSSSSDWFRFADEPAVPSPALVLFSGRIDANLQLMVELAGDIGRLGPHIKTDHLAPSMNAGPSPLALAPSAPYS